MKKFLAFLAIGLSITLQAYAESNKGFFSGKELNDFCNQSKSLCIGYVTGIADYAAQKPNKTLCIQTGVTPEQLSEIVKKWMREHPENWHYSAVSLVEAAIAEAYGCM